MSESINCLFCKRKLVDPADIRKLGKSDITVCPACQGKLSVKFDECYDAESEIDYRAACEVLKDYIESSGYAHDTVIYTTEYLSKYLADMRNARRKEQGIGNIMAASQPLLSEETIEQKRQELIDNGYDGYWEYKTVSLSDMAGDERDIAGMEKTLNMLSLDGWRLRAVYESKEDEDGSANRPEPVFGEERRGQDDLSAMIFERFVKLQKPEADLAPEVPASKEVEKSGFFKKIFG